MCLPKWNGSICEQGCGGIAWARCARGCVDVNDDEVGENAIKWIVGRLGCVGDVQ